MFIRLHAVVVAGWLGYQNLFIKKCYQLRLSIVQQASKHSSSITADGYIFAGKRMAQYPSFLPLSVLFMQAGQNRTETQDRGGGGQKIITSCKG